MIKWKSKFKSTISFVLGIIFCACASVLAETCSTTLSSGNITYGNTTAEAEVTSLLTQAGNLNSRVTDLENNKLNKTGYTANRIAITNGSGQLTTTSSVDTTELSYLDGVTSAIQTQINNKAAKSGYTANRAMVSDGSGNLAVSGTIDTTELGYLNGVTSNIQTQLNAKLASGNIYVRRQSGTASNGVVANLTIPSGFSNASNVFVTSYYASNDAQYLTIQLVSATKYHAYFRSQSGSVNGAVSWVELWIK